MRKAIIGALGIITVIVLLCISGCQLSDNVTQEEQPTLIHLRPGRKLVSCGWNDNRGQVWYLTRSMGAEEKATEYEYWNGVQSRLIIKEEARRDMSGYRDLDAIRQMRMRR